MAVRFIGASVPRVEDPRILTGRGRYVDDVQLPRMLHAAFVRSPVAHARIAGLRLNAAREAPGVVQVLTGEDVVTLSKPIAVPLAAELHLDVCPYHALATTKVRMVGDLVAMVIAETRYQAEDAADLVDVEYDPLPVVSDTDTALGQDSPLVFEETGSNVVSTSSHTYGDVDGAFAAADRTIAVTLRQHRVANSPMETRGGVADYDVASGELTFHAATQSPHGLRVQLATVLDLPMERLRVLAGDVGGAFGLKGGVFREDFCLAIASRLLGRPVKWIEDRNEHLIASGHAREETVDAEVAVLDDGTVLGIKARMTMDQGAYPWVPYPASLYAGLVRTLLPGPYRVRGYSFEFIGVATNKCTYVAYRGPWAVETWVRERLLDTVAHELGLDPADVRRVNLQPGGPDDRLVTGPSLAGISSLESLDRALELVDYPAFRREQVAARERGRHLGIGFAIFLEPAPGPPEMRSRLVSGEQARVRLEADGHVTVVTAQAPHGQSHETTLAQIAADELGVPLDHVKVVHGDTRITPVSLIGTGGSRAATWASGAVTLSTRRLREKVLAIAAELLEIGPDDLELADGVIVPRGVPDRALPLADLARQAILAPGTLPPGVDHDLEAHETFAGEGITGSGWSGGTHLCTVEVDLATGFVDILRYVVVEDCGRIINPSVVDGQISGGVAQGIGAVLYEHMPYDHDGNVLAGTFVDYLVPTAAEIPTIEIEHLEQAADGDLSYRGVGEGGAIVAPATLTNAIEDALLPLGVRVHEQHLPPNRLLELARVIR
jgi:carbon-monoxide dehydrogenase large subunit